jgi:hypothetical protein
MLCYGTQNTRVCSGTLKKWSREKTGLNKMYSLYREKETSPFSSPIPLFCRFKLRMRAIECCGGGSYPYFSNRIKTDMLMLLNQTISSENHLFHDSLKQETVLPHIIYPQNKKDFKHVWEVLKKSCLTYYVCKTPKNIPLQKAITKLYPQNSEMQELRLSRQLLGRFLYVGCYVD